tara:strand:+ start:203 stop:817 length:615 start_codon:yes stop_codon:yes gene_type:complete
MALIKTNARSATALDATILTGNIPALNGSAITTINATNISSGTLNAARYSGGKILQVTQRETTTATSAITSDTLSATDVYASITPSATSSNVIIMMNFRSHVTEGSGSGTTMAMGIKRDIGGAGYSDVYLPLDSEFGHWTASLTSERSHHARFTLTCLDAPNTTSACTYKLYVRDMGTSTTGDNVYVGGSSTEMSTVLMEVDGS